MFFSTVVRGHFACILFIFALFCESDSYQYQFSRLSGKTCLSSLLQCAVDNTKRGARHFDAKLHRLMFINFVRFYKFILVIYAVSQNRTANS